MSLIKQFDHNLSCPRCRLKTGVWFNFGKRARCLNCNHIWTLRWKGAKNLSTQVRQAYV